MSGLRLNRYDNDGNYGGDCSSAFMTYARADFSVRYVLSAAHCSRIGGTGPETLLQRRHVHEHIGPANNRKLGGTTDAERIKLVQSPWLNSSKTVVDGTLPRMIDTYKTYAQINIGDYVGKTGARTGTTRGYVGSKSEAPSFIPNSSNFIRASFCVAERDSGAGVWEQRNALGIVSARWDVKACRHAETFDFSVGQGIFGAVEFAMDALNVGLLTNRNIRPRARFTASCLAFECTFSGAPSYDWDGAIVNYAWDFGDGTTGSGQNASKTYTTAGTKTVTLTVTDNDGEPSNPKSETVTIPSLPILE